MFSCFSLLGFDYIFLGQVGENREIQDGRSTTHAVLRTLKGTVLEVLLLSRQVSYSQF